MTRFALIALAGALCAPAGVSAQSAAPPPATAPALPDYFTGANPSAGKPKWPDPTGQHAGTAVAPAGDGKGDGDPSKMGPADLYARIAHNGYAINIIWVMICAFLVMFMQCGFALVETGLTRAGNAAHTMGMNFMIYPLACFGFWLYGFGMGWGNWYNGPTPSGWVSTLGPGISTLNGGFGLGPEVGADGAATGRYQMGIIGTKGYMLQGCDDVSVLCMFFFMMLFMDTTATIPTGALAERWAWKNFCLFGLWIAFPYCLFANWVWGGGWLAQSGVNWGLGHGAVDFAGSGVVHLMGGSISLAGLLVMGPRLGKYVQGRPAALPGHNLPFVVVGTFILALGWFGFNAGSTLGGTDLRLVTVAVNTMLGSVGGAIGCQLTLMAKGMKPDPSMLCNGMLCGLVSVTAACAFIDTWAALVIGGVGGVIVVNGVLFFEDYGLDDPVGALSVHGLGGLWGVVAVGIFANGKYGAGFNGVERENYVARFGSDGVRGLLYGDASQLGAQLLEAGTCAAVGFVLAYLWFELSDRITPIRVPAEYEERGLDVPEMGAQAYPDHLTRPARPV